MFLVHADGVIHEGHINGNAVVIDPAVNQPHFMFLGTWAVAYQRIADGPFRHNVLSVVLLENLPFIRGITWHIASTASVGLRGAAGNTKILDKRLASGVFLLIFRESKYLGVHPQPCRKGVIKSQYRITFPLVIRNSFSTKDRLQTGNLKIGIVCSL